MTLAVLILILASNITLIAGGFYVVRKAQGVFSSITENISGYFEIHGEGDNQTSGFTETVSGVSDIIASKIGVTTQMAIKGSLGGSMKAINKELEQEAIAENPNLAMAEFLPKSLKKNPIALIGLNQVLGRLMAGGLGGSQGSQGSGSPGSNGQAQFNL